MNITQQHHLLKKYNAETIISTLEPYLTENRKNRIQAVIDNRLSSIQLAIESPADINNALATIRSSESFGIETIHIIQPESHAGSARTITQGAIYWVNVMYHTSFTAFHSILQKGRTLLAGGMPHASLPVSKVPVDQPLCILVGNEQRGLSQTARKACDYPYHIPTVGMSESLNLSVSAAISLYDLTSRKREHLKKPSDLTDKEKKTLLAKYYLASLAHRLVNALLP